MVSRTPSVVALHASASSARQWQPLAAACCKNLFLRNSKGNVEYLAIVEHAKRVDLKRLAAFLGEDKLSFGSADRLRNRLGLAPGAVSR